jgi:hypothetical protein
MPQLSEQSMGTAKSLGDFVKSPNIGGAGDMGSPADLLGQIYDLMLKIQEEQDIDHELSMRDEKKKEKRESDRNAALIKALTARKKPKVKKPPKKKEEVKKEEKPPTKPAEKKAAEKKVEEKKPETKKAEEKVKKDEAVKKQVDKESEKAKQQAQKEADKAKKTAEKEQASAKKKAEEESRKKETAEPVKPPEVKPPTATKAPQELGKLSSKFETGGRKNAGAIIGYDSTGGTSYGTYQIAAKVGAMAAFLKFAEAKGETDIVSRLKSAGPADTGSDKGQFVDEWKKISAERGKEFDKLQHDFIEESQYKPAVKTLLKGTGYDVENQPAIIKDVFFSTVVQHGPGSAKNNNGAYGIFKKAIDDNGGPNASPKDIINSVYEIRGTKFSSSTEKVRKSVQDRFVQEKAQALDALKNEGNNLNQSSKENADLNANLEKQQPTTINNVGTSTAQQPATPINQAKVDDRSPMQRKMQG